MKFGELLESLKLKHGEDPDENFDPVQLKAGTKVEMEHTTDPSIAKQIAKAHLSEFPNYYKGLKKMEQQLKMPKSVEKRLNVQKGKI
jgi:hypothetical protein